MRNTLGLLVLAFCLLPLAVAQPRRIPNRIDDGRMRVLLNHVPHDAVARMMRARVDPSLPLEGIALFLKPTAAQQTALDGFLADVQNPRSRTFIAGSHPSSLPIDLRVGASDIGRLSTWLESHGFHPTATARGRSWLSFRGTAAQVRTTFHTEIHRLPGRGTRALREQFRSIDSSRTGPMSSAGWPASTISTPFAEGPSAMQEMTAASGVHTLAPDDLATIYGHQAALSGGHRRHGPKNGGRGTVANQRLGHECLPRQV